MAFRRDAGGDDYAAFTHDGYFTGSRGFDRFVRILYIDDRAEKDLPPESRRKMFVEPHAFAAVLR